MNKWHLKDFVSHTGRNQIADWYELLSAQARSDFDALIDILEKKEDWSYPEYKDLKRKHKGVGEIRWKTEKTQHRVLGYSPSDHVFVLLIGCTHKMNIYNPPEALDTALERKKKVESGEAGTCDHETEIDFKAQE